MIFIHQFLTGSYTDTSSVHDTQAGTSTTQEDVVSPRVDIDLTLDDDTFHLDDIFGELLGNKAGGDGAEGPGDVEGAVGEGMGMGEVIGAFRDGIGAGVGAVEEGMGMGVGAVGEGMAAGEGAVEGAAIEGAAMEGGVEAANGVEAPNANHVVPTHKWMKRLPHHYEVVNDWTQEDQTWTF